MISEFNRNKVVDVARLDDDTLVVHGILDDSIYSLELDFKVQVSDLTCFEIGGRWLRWTTPECPKALDFLAQAEGFCLACGIDEKIHKTIGRSSCRHFANLFIECAYAVRETVKLMRWQAAKSSGSKLSCKDFLAQEKSADGSLPKELSVEVEVKSEAITTTTNAVSVPVVGPSKKPLATVNLGGAGFIVDLHLHTAPASPCASDSVDAMIVEAKRIGLNGVCLTDHNYLWSPEDIQALREKHDFLILRANEIVTEQGDMLVFGFYEDVQGIIKLKELKKLVAAVGGFIVAAHPFRGFLTFGADDIGLTKEKASSRDMFQWVDGVESLNGKVTETENGLARDVAVGLGLPATGGSDAHDILSVGLYATAFAHPIKSEEELLVALKEGKYQPVTFR
ncbi:PHP domain-containing protein [bacterium]|nr:PHP domain-containing protein [bacterium]